MNLNLTGHTALVMGASQGLGQASAIELANLGCRIIALARNEDKLKELCKELNTINHKDNLYVAIDMNDHELLTEAIKDLIAQQGTISILINNSGGPKSGPITLATASDFNNAFHQHLQTYLLLTQLLLPGMQAQQFGRIINIISTSVKTPLPSLGVSNTTRWAVAAWAKTLAGEVAKYGITVNNVLPGALMTDRITALWASNAQAEGVTEQAIEQRWLETIPMGRFGKPEELGAAVAFLASPAASYITGTALAVDGGRTPSL